MKNKNKLYHEIANIVVNNCTLALNKVFKVYTFAHKNKLFIQIHKI